MAIPVYVINRECDTARMAAFAASATKKNIDFERVPAIDGHAPGFPLPDEAGMTGPHFWGADRIKPGALACFLSHRRAWLRLVENDASHALICEDDIEIRESPARVLQVVGGAEILFCNQRLADWAMAAGETSRATGLDRVIARLAARGGPGVVEGLRPAPGADCYLLCREGAMQLLALAERDGVVCGVDWAMIWYGLDTRHLTAETLSGFSELAILARHNVRAPAAIGVKVLTCPLSVQSVRHKSVIQHDVTVPIASLRSHR